MSIFDSWSIREVRSDGEKFKAICKINDGYEHSLTVGKEYEIIMAGYIMPMNPLCELIGDTNSKVTCHVLRFEKVVVNDNNI